MSDVYFGLAFQALRCVASRVECELPGTPAQKTNAAPVSDAHENVQIQGERLGAREDPATTPVLIAQFHLVRSAADELAQFLTLKQHVVWVVLWCLLSR